MTETENKIMQFLSERESDDLYMLATKLHVHGGSGAVFAESLDACVDAVMSLLDVGKIERKAKALPSTGWVYALVKPWQAITFDDAACGVVKQLHAYGRRYRQDLIKYSSCVAAAPYAISDLHNRGIIKIAEPGIREWFDVFELTNYGRNLFDSSEI